MVRKIEGFFSQRKHANLKRALPGEYRIIKRGGKMASLNYHIFEFHCSYIIGFQTLRKENVTVLHVKYSLMISKPSSTRQKNIYSSFIINTS